MFRRRPSLLLVYRKHFVGQVRRKDKFKESLEASFQAPLHAPILFQPQHSILIGALGIPITGRLTASPRFVQNYIEGVASSTKVSSRNRSPRIQKRRKFRLKLDFWQELQVGQHQEHLRIFQARIKEITTLSTAPIHRAGTPHEPWLRKYHSVYFVCWARHEDTAAVCVC